MNETEKIRNILKNAQSVCVISHVKPDGDAFGSSLALYFALTKMGKSVSVVLSDGVPDMYGKFNGTAEVVTTIPPKRFDAVILVDIANFSRTGLSINMPELSDTLIIIDHHIVEEYETGADPVFIDTSYAAVGEMIFEILEPMGCIDVNAAESMYISIVTDTGCFKYSNTTSRTHSIVSQLMMYGIRSEYIMEKLYSENAPSKIALLGRSLATLRFKNDIAYAFVDDAMLQECSSSEAETDGIVNHINSIAGIRACVLFHDTNGKRKVSLRSRGIVDVSAVARQFGGGGHKNASGFVTSEPLDTIQEKILLLL